MDYNAISGGIGFREKGFSIDLGYTHLGSAQIYLLIPAGFLIQSGKGKYNDNQNMFTLTLAYKIGY